MSRIRAAVGQQHGAEYAGRIERSAAPQNCGCARRRPGARPWLTRSVCPIVAFIVLVAPTLLAGQALAGSPGHRVERQVPLASRDFTGCVLQGPSRFPESGNVAVTYRAPSGWGCGAVRGLWDRAEHVDGDGGRTFRFLKHRWQCVTIARPDHGRHTTFGCFHVHWKVHYDTEDIPGKPIVRFFLPVTAD